MNLVQLIELTSVKGDEPYYGMIARSHGRRVTRNNFTVNFFHDEKDAAAWIYHVYGCSPWEAKKQGIEILHLKDYVPSPGDAVVYDGSGEYSALSCAREDYKDIYHKSGRGVLLTYCDHLVAHFNPFGIWRSEDYVSASGGPACGVEPKELQLIGFRELHFQRWSDGLPRADSAGNFIMTVPLWRWHCTLQYTTHVVANES